MKAPWQKLGFQLKLGLRPRQESCWLPRKNLFGNDTERDEQIHQKQHLFDHNHGDIFAAFPSARSASAEMLQMVCDHITSHHLMLFFAGGTDKGFRAIKTQITPLHSID